MPVDYPRGAGGATKVRCGRTAPTRTNRWIAGSRVLHTPPVRVLPNERPRVDAFRIMRRIDQYLGPPVCLLLGAAKLVVDGIRPRAGGTGEIRKVLVIKFW